MQKNKKSLKIIKNKKNNIAIFFINLPKICLTFIIIFILS